MMRRAGTKRIAALLVSAAALLIAATGAAAQRGGASFPSRDHPAIQYASRAPTDRIAALDKRIAAGEVRLSFDKESGYLPSVLDALNVPAESQVVVFSQTSVQAELITPSNPRALFFTDHAAVGWVRGAGTLELAAHDPEQGVIFYTLAQQETPQPQFQRETRCLLCHLSADTSGVPGLLTFTTQSIPQDKYSYASGFASDHRTPLPERWGGWYVTGRAGSRHLGNSPVPQLLRPAGRDAVQPRVLDSLQGVFDLKGFPTAHSDVVALMVLEHQTRMTNLLTRLGWEARVAAADRRAPVAPVAPVAAVAPVALEEAARDVVDYLLFVDEAPLEGHVRGSSGFASAFSKLGPRDGSGRSLRQLDLERRLLRYPCSYMIYSEAFARLPDAAKEAVYQRLWRVLSGQERQAPYERLSAGDRRAVVEILNATMKGLPGYFRGTVE